MSDIRGCPGCRLVFDRSLCHDCREPPCVDACPSQALRRGIGESGVDFQKQRCRGCNICIMVCPFNAVARAGDWGTGCDACGGEPQRALACRPGAIRSVDPNLESRDRRRLIAERLTAVSTSGRPWS